LEISHWNTGFLLNTPRASLTQLTNHSVLPRSVVILVQTVMGPWKLLSPRQTRMAGHPKYMGKSHL
jgi:hypothetical protein